MLFANELYTVLTTDKKGVNATFTKPDEILKSKDKTEQSEVNNT